MSSVHRLTIKIDDIYKGVVRIEDTAHYVHPDVTNYQRVDGGAIITKPFASWISFLDVKLTWNPKSGKITSRLYVKKIVLDLAIGVDVKNSDTDTRQMSMVYASETLRFYFACGEYSDFLHHCVRYMLSFLDKHYPFYLLMSGFLSLWRSGRHSFTKYTNSPTIWHEDIMHRIPTRYTQKRRSLIAPASTAASSHVSLQPHSNTPSPHLDYPTAPGTSIPGFISGGHTDSNSNSGGFYATSTLTTHHNARMKYRRRMDHLRRLNHHMNQRYGTNTCLLYTSPSPRDRTRSRMPSSA